MIETAEKFQASGLIVKFEGVDKNKGKSELRVHQASTIFIVLTLLC